MILRNQIKYLKCKNKFSYHNGNTVVEKGSVLLGGSYSLGSISQNKNQKWKMVKKCRKKCVKKTMWIF